MRDPVIPKGCPIDIDPPFTFSLVQRDAQPVAAIDHLHRERLVQLPQVDVIGLQPVPR